MSLYRVREYHYDGLRSDRTTREKINWELTFEEAFAKIPIADLQRITSGI